MDVGISMDHDGDFDDLLEGFEVLQGSSQELLTNAAANLRFDNCDLIVDAGCSGTPLTSEYSGHDADEHEYRERGASSTEDVQIAEKPADSDEIVLYFTPPPSPSSRPQLSALDKIELIFEQMADVLLNEKLEMSIELKRRTKPTQAEHGGSSLATPQSEIKTRCLRFPGKTAEEAWRFAVVVRILEFMHEALRNDTVLSKRDIYYRDPALFGSQTHVDRYVDEIALTFSVPRAALNVTAVAKGLIAGSVTFCRRDGWMTDASGDREGMLVPSLKDMLSVDMRKARWILVIEKEATFRSIAASGFWTTIASNGIIVTGKGYPDIATRALLRFLSTASPQNDFCSPPVYGLMDFDPDGMAMLSVYKHGSAALAHENAELRVPKLKWLGMQSRHIILATGSDDHASQGLLTLTTRDRQKAKRMLERSFARQSQSGEHKDNGDRDHVGFSPSHVPSALNGLNDEDQQAAEDTEWCRELQVMMMLNMKAELQLLDGVQDGMKSLLTGELNAF